MSNSEILEEMLIHIHSANLIVDFNSRVENFKEKNTKLDFFDITHNIYSEYLKNGLIQESVY